MKIIDIDQQSDAWLLWRSVGLGASDAPLLWYGQHFERTLADLFAEKLGHAERDRRRRSSWAQEQGKRFEEGARAWYEDLTGTQAPPVCCVHDYHAWLRASLDGWVAPSKVVLEIKWANYDDHALALGGEVPAKYKPQLWHQAIVTGCSSIHYLSGSANKRFSKDDWKTVVPYDPSDDQDKLDELLKRLIRFQAAIAAGTPITFDDLTS